MDKPTEEERLKFVKSYGVEPVTDINTDLTVKDAAKTVAEFTPIIGDAIAAKEVYDELMKDEPNYGLIAALGGAALVGAVPGIGDAAAAGIRKAVDVAKRVEVDPDAVGMMGGNIRIKPKKTEYDAMIAELDKAETVDEWQTNAKALIEEGRVEDPVIRTPELEDSTRQLLEGKITRDQHLANVDEFKPVSGYDQLPREPSDKAVVFGLNDAQRKDGHFLIDDNKGLGVNKSSLKVGDDFNGRLDIPAYNAYDVWIVTGNSKQAEKGKHYLKAVHYEATDDKPVRFLASERTSEKIGTGEKGKTPYATVAGRVKDLDVEKIRATAAELLDDPEWTQVGFDPRRQGGFYVRAGENKNVPVREATEVIQIGPLVLAKNAKLDLEYEGYNEGGMAMEEQMAMNFGDVPDNTIGVDPVSGNDIPIGSTAENVRDDVPAMLSEGEIVVPADVVNFHGVKLFEDLRAEAKMGYAEMAQDGRIGGEPMDDDMEMENDIGLELADLEVMIIPDDEEPVEMRRGGMNFERGRGNIYKSYSAPKPTPRVVRSAPPSYKTRSVGSLKDSSPRSYTPAQPRSYTPAQLGITKIQAPTTSGPERPTLTSKPATSDTANIGNSIAQQIGMYDKDFREKTVEPKSTAERLADIRKRNQERYQGAGYVDKARDFVGGLFGFGDEQEKEGPQRVQITGDADYGFLGSPLERANRKGLGPRFDEGGMAVEPFYDQKGGFGDLDYSGIQAREYMNDLGQKIIIMFQDGVPLTPIPDGYYPVAETVTPAVDSTYNVDTVNAMTGTGSYAGSVPVSAPVSSGDGGDPGGNLNMVMPTPVNYKELSLEELQDMLEDQGSLKQKGILAAASAINPIMALAIRAAMWDTSRKTKAEIERRLGSGDTSEVDKMRYTNMLEIAEREKPSLLDRLTGKAFEKEYSQIPSPDIPAVDFSDPTLAPDQGIAEPYTPEVTTPHVTEPMMDTDDKEATVEPVTLGADPQPEVETVPLVPGTSYTLDELTQPTPAQQIQQQRDRTRDAGRSARQTFEAFRKDPSMSKSIAENPAAVQRTESVIRDMERGVQRGFEKGGMVEEPAVKEVVKGLKKASKSHAKQADQLEKALKASKKKKKSK